MSDLYCIIRISNKGQDMDYSQDYCFLCNSTENVYQYDHYEGGELVYSDICNECMKGNK